MLGAEWLRGGQGGGLSGGSQLQRRATSQRVWGPTEEAGKEEQKGKLWGWCNPTLRGSPK